MGPRRGLSCRRRRALVAAAICAAALATPARAAAQGVEGASTPDGSELIETIPITSSAGADREVAYSINPKHMPALAPGDVLVIGNDQPDGTVHGGRGRLNTTVTAPGEEALAQSLSSTTRVSKRIPLGAENSGFQTVAYSVRVDGLMPGDVVAATARQVTGIASLTLPAFVADQVLLAASPTAVSPNRSYSPAKAQLTPGNGFHCTKGL